MDTQTGIRGLFRPEMGGVKHLAKEPRSAKIEKNFLGAPVRSAFNIAGSATFRHNLNFVVLTPDLAKIQFS